MTEIPKPYGEEHRKAKQEALHRSNGKCELTNKSARDLIGHHVYPRSLTFHNFTDNPNNYLILRERVRFKNEIIISHVINMKNIK